MQPLFEKVIAPLLDALPDTVIVVDEAGSILFANQAILPLLGHTPADLIDRPLSTLLPPNVRAAHERMIGAFWQRPAPRAMGERPFLHALHKDGEEVPVTISLAPIMLQGQRCCVAVLRDASSMQNRITNVLGRIQI